MRSQEEIEQKITEIEEEIKKLRKRLVWADKRKFQAKLDNERLQKLYTQYNALCYVLGKMNLI